MSYICCFGLKFDARNLVILQGSNLQASSIRYEKISKFISLTLHICQYLLIFFCLRFAACGHISCSWCVCEAMDTYQESRCPVCRHSYHHFPSICWLLHSVLLKLYPKVYQRRESQVTGMLCLIFWLVCCRWIILYGGLVNITIDRCIVFPYSRLSFQHARLP